MRTFFLFVFFLSLFFIFEVFAEDYDVPERFNVSSFGDILEFEQELSKRNLEYKPWIQTDFDPSGKLDLIYDAGYVFRYKSGEVAGYILSDSDQMYNGTLRLRIAHSQFDSSYESRAVFERFVSNVIFALANLMEKNKVKVLILDTPFQSQFWFKFFGRLLYSAEIVTWSPEGSGDLRGLELRPSKPLTLSDIIVGSFYSKENKRHVDLMGDGRILVYDQNVNVIREFPADTYNTYREVYFQEKSLIIYYPEMQKKFVYNGRTLEFVFVLDVIDMAAIRALPVSCRGYFQ